MKTRTLLSRKVSYADRICIKEVLALFPMEKLLPTSIIWNKFKNEPEKLLPSLEISTYEYSILRIGGCRYSTDFIEYEHYDFYCLTEKGKEFIKLVKARKQTRYLLNKGCDLFPETAILKTF